MSSLTPATSVILLGHPSLLPQELIVNVNITANDAAIKNLDIDFDLFIVVKLKIKFKFCK